MQLQVYYNSLCNYKYIVLVYVATSIAEWILRLNMIAQNKIKKLVVISRIAGFSVK